MENERKSIWQVLEEWSNQLDDWQKFILVNIVNRRTLTESKIVEATDFFKKSTGLVSSENLPAIPAFEVPPQTDGTAELRLKELFELRNINAIPETSRLTFGRDLTVIYGRNATGKSGYCRIMQDACFSRAEVEILPNVYAEDASGRQSAQFTLSSNDQSREVIHEVGGSDEDLRRFYVFDIHSAHVHIAEENDLGFSPVGFDVFAEMARAYGEIQSKLQSEIDQIPTDNTFAGAYLPPDTEIKKEIESLSTATDLKKLHELAVFGEKEQERLEAVMQMQSDLQTKAPEQMINDTKEALDDTKALRERLTDLGDSFSLEKRTGYQTKLSRLRATLKRVAEFDITQFKDEDFKAVGTKAWERFLAAGFALAKLEGEGYPVEGDRCLLCRQELNDSSAAFIHSLWHFIDGEARKENEEATKDIEALKENLGNLNLGIFGEESRVRSHISRIKVGLVGKIDEALSNFTSDRDQIIAALNEVQEVIPNKTHNDVCPRLVELEEELTHQVDELRKDKKDALLGELEAERNFLRHKQVLSQQIDTISKYVKGLCWVEKANDALVNLNTRHITDKQREAFRTVIEDNYRQSLVRECDDLGWKVPIQWKTRGERGTTKKSINVAGRNPETVLSEGEQRAVALADFLTEVSLNPKSAGIIFDDPVTSLDYPLKEKIATRLVTEAKDRQVIIFTHDLVFLNALRTQAKEQEIHAEYHWVQRSEEKPGLCTLNDSPVLSMEYKKTAKAEKAMQEAMDLSGSERVTKVREGMSYLRTTVEQTVVQHLFKGVVRQWEDRVVMGALKNINWSNELADQSLRLFVELSRRMEGHIHSEVGGEVPPDVDELEKKIAEVNELIKKTKTSRQS